MDPVNPFKFGSPVDDDPEVIEVAAFDCPTSSSRKRQRTKKIHQEQAVPHDVIEIDEDDHPGVVVVGEKVNTCNKGKDKLTSYKGYLANQVKEALAQDFMVPSIATEIGLINNVPLNPLKSSGIGSTYLCNLSGGSLNAGFSDFPYYHNDALYYDNTTGLQAPFDSMELRDPFPWHEQPAEIFPKLDTSSSSSIPNLLNSTWYKDKTDEFWLQQSAQSRKKPASASNAAVPCQPSYYTRKEDEDEVLKKYRAFKQFDTVSNYSDHHYSRQSSTSKQPPPKWAKAIQQEWRTLEKDLPDSIFVRVYEERMDLLRAVIVGAAGTPYHDGLFFFDIFFPANYPNVPPLVNYHARGLRLNPNLYACGKVCLSLLNTWHGSKEEKWTPKKSTVLQVLLSIQALVLNSKPFFNEPGYAPMAGGKEGEKRAHEYNENTYILSCRTMLFTLRTPPKHFEEFVAGHFRKLAHAILVACKAYMDGAQVGCLAGGGVQDLDEGDKSSSQNFKAQVASMVKLLVPAFVQNGSKGCEQFLPQTNNFRYTIDNLRRASGYR